MSNISALEIELEKKQTELKPILKRLKELRHYKNTGLSNFGEQFNKKDRLARILVSEIEELTELIKNMKRLRS